MRTAPIERPRLWAWAVVGVCLIGLVVALAVRSPAAPSETDPESRPAQGAGTDSPDNAEESAVETPARAARRTGSVRAEAPRSVVLPNGDDVAVRTVGTTRDGTLAVPRDIRLAGWWRGGSRLGDPFGSTLIAAHVDSTTQGLGPFASLLEVKRGDRFVVTSPELRQVFRATSLRLLDQGPLLRHRWMFGPGGDRRVVLATCAPPYDKARGGYQRLAVVTAKPVGLPSPRGSR